MQRVLPISAPKVAPKSRLALLMMDCGSSSSSSSKKRHREQEAQKKKKETGDQGRILLLTAFKGGLPASRFAGQGCFAGKGCFAGQGCFEGQAGKLLAAPISKEVKFVGLKPYSKEEDQAKKDRAARTDHAARQAKLRRWQAREPP